MDAIQRHEGIVCPLDRVNVDTDQIIPKQFLKRIERQGFGQFLFYHWRFHNNGNKRTDFIINDPAYEQASILVAGDNFGCGSSREHAPWALLDYGFKVIITPSFADIFYNNSIKNGILLVKLSEEEVAVLLEKAKQRNYRLKVDLEAQTVSDRDGFHATFDINSYSKKLLINGWDEISLTLQLQDRIQVYEQKTS